MSSVANYKVLEIGNIWCKCFHLKTLMFYMVMQVLANKHIKLLKL